MTTPIRRRNILYQTRFAPVGRVPDGWNEWYGEYHPASWDGSLKLGNTADLTVGAFYSLSTEHEKFLATFLFRVPDTLPITYEMEICDLYDKGWNEICNSYLTPKGQILLYVGGKNASIQAPPPGTWVRIWQRYDKGAGSVAWAMNGQCEPHDGPQRAAVTEPSESAFKTPVCRILHGPWWESIAQYDNLQLVSD